MPVSPPSLCTQPGCGTLVHTGGRCDQHRREARRDSDARRPNGYARGWTTKWATFSKHYLTEHPHCTTIGCTQPATDIDHIDGTGRNGPRAYDLTNLIALCHACHSRKTALHDGGYGRNKHARD